MRKDHNGAFSIGKARCERQRSAIHEIGAVFAVFASPVANMEHRAPHGIGAARRGAVRMRGSGRAASASHRIGIGIAMRRGVEEGVGRAKKRNDARIFQYLQYLARWRGEWVGGSRRLKCLLRKGGRDGVGKGGMGFSICLILVSREPRIPTHDGRSTVELVPRDTR